MERVYLDRIEGDRAVLLCGEGGREKLTIPTRLLPPDTREGAALDLTLAAAPEDRTKAEVEDLMGELFGDKPK